MYIMPLSKGYRNPLAALWEQVTAGVPELPRKSLGAMGFRPVTAKENLKKMVIQNMVKHQMYF